MIALHRQPLSLGVSVRLFLIGLTAVPVITALIANAVPFTQALFTNTQTDNATLSTAQIFRATRSTPAFVVSDASSGSAVDGTSPLAVASDSRYATHWTWPTSFSSSRYLDFDLNSPLPAGLSVSSVQLTVRISAETGGATACYYVEVRRVSTGSLLSTHGSSGSPLACVTGTTFASQTPSLAAVTTTDEVNDLRIRVFGRDDTGARIRVDRVIVSGSSPHASFTLYPSRTRDTHDSQTDVVPWGLAGP